MSDHIPFHIQAEIMKKLPVKSLLQFRSVSKQWKSLIDSSEFITDHSLLRHNQPRHLLVQYAKSISAKIYDRNYVSFVDNDDDHHFPQNHFSITFPETVNLSGLMWLMGYSRGVLCLFYYDHRKVVMWNPSIRKYAVIMIPNPNVIDMKHVGSVVGFGVCPNTSDPKLVKIATRDILSDFDNKFHVSWEAVEVYSLSSGVWRGIPINRTLKPCFLNKEHVDINGIIYFDAYDCSNMSITNMWFTGRYRKRIITFDLTSEEFGEIHLPDDLVYSSGVFYHLFKLMESLVVIKSYEDARQPFSDVWMMKHGVPNSFEKLYTIKSPEHSHYRVLGFRKNGEAILESSKPSRRPITIEIYEPYSGHITDLGIYGNNGALSSFFVSPYKETLLLLDQSDSIVN